jgi:hypothetical protein
MGVILRCGLLLAAIAGSSCEKKEPAGAVTDAPEPASEPTAPETSAAGGPGAPVGSGGPVADRAAEAALGAADRAAALADRAGAAATTAGQQAAETANRAGAAATAAGQQAAEAANRAGESALAAGQQAAETANRAGAAATAAGQQAAEAANRAGAAATAAGQEAAATASQAAALGGVLGSAVSERATGNASQSASVVLPADFPLQLPVEATGSYSEQIDGRQRHRSGVFAYTGAPAPVAESLEKAMSDRGLTPRRTATRTGQTRVTTLRAVKGDVQATAVVTTAAPGATQIVVSWIDPAP